MITRGEIVRSLTGAVEIFLDRADAMNRFDLSVEGFWRSFQAIVLVIPSYLIVVLAERAVLVNLAADSGAPMVDEATHFFAKALALAVDWVALPALMAFAAKPFGVADRYAAFVVARNWSAVLIMLPYAAIALFFAMGMFGSQLASFLSLAVLIVALRFMYMVTRHSLQIPAGFAIAIVVFDFVLSLTIGLAVDALFGIAG